MYEEYWKLRFRPFRNTPDPSFFYRSAQHEEALMKLSYAVNENMGAAMVTGDYGCGKTMLVQVLLSRLGPTTVSAFCAAQPDMSSLDLLRLLAREIGGQPLPSARSDLVADALLEIVARRLTENHRDGRHTLVVMDEAHLLAGDSVLETTRSLLNFQTLNGFLLTLLLLGHPELADRVARLKQLAQRIPITCRLTHLGPEETQGYILRRLAVAGRTDPIFTPDAVDTIHRHAGGIPRRVNTLCDVSLALGCAVQAQAVDAALVMEAARKFGTP
jgi:general secretion pathway protein A